MWFIVLLISSGCAMSRAQYPDQSQAQYPDQSQAQYPDQSRAQYPDPAEKGFSDQYKSENTLGEYTFGYNEDHTSGGSFRRETSDRLGNKIGSYGLRVGDGRVRIVNYVADHNGFRADVISNEPGIESQDTNEYSKITKKNVYSVLVPGFRYSAAAPYVTFQRNQQDMDKYSGLIDETAQSYDAEDIDFDGEDPRTEYLNEEIQDDYPAGALVNDDGRFENVYSEEVPSHIFINDGQFFEDSFLAGEFSHDSETILQNQTANASQESNSTNVSSDYEDKNSEFAPTTISPEPQRDSSEDLRLSYEKYRPMSAGEDLYPFQSNVVLSESTENLSSQDQKNETLSETDSSEIQTTTTISTTIDA